MHTNKRTCFPQCDLQLVRLQVSVPVQVQLVVENPPQFWQKQQRAAQLPRVPCRTSPPRATRRRRRRTHRPPSCPRTARTRATTRAARMTRDPARPCTAAAARPRTSRRAAARSATDPGRRTARGREVSRCMPRCTAIGALTYWPSAGMERISGRGTAAGHRGSAYGAGS